MTRALAFGDRERAPLITPEDLTGPYRRAAAPSLEERVATLEAALAKAEIDAANERVLRMRADRTRWIADGVYWLMLAAAYAILVALGGGL